MPLPRAIAKLNRVGLNRITRLVVPRLPGFGLVLHVGRRSGRVYRTPVNVFTGDGRYTFALTYGAETDWVRNVLEYGGCEVIHRNRRVRLVEPRIVHDEACSAVPPVVRFILARLKVSDFLVLDVAPSRPHGQDGPAA